MDSRRILPDRPVLSDLISAISHLRVSKACFHLLETRFNQTCSSGLVTTLLTMSGQMITTRWAMLPTTLPLLYKGLLRVPISQFSQFKEITILGPSMFKTSHYPTSISQLTPFQVHGLNGLTLKFLINLLTMVTIPLL